MTSKNIFRSMRDIDPQLILDAAPDMPQKKKTSCTRVKWTSLAACLALIVAVTTMILPTIRNEDHDSGTVKMHIFSSYEEFSGVVPDINVAENICQMDGIEFDIYGAFKDSSIKDATKSENFSHYEFDFRKEGQQIAYMTITPDDIASAEKHIENSALTNEKEINGISVFYVYNPDNEYWDSVIVIGETYYNIFVYAESEQEFVDFLEFALNN